MKQPHPFDYWVSAARFWHVTAQAQAVMAMHVFDMSGYWRLSKAIDVSGPADATSAPAASRRALPAAPMPQGAMELSERVVPLRRGPAPSETAGRV